MSDMKCYPLQRLGELVSGNRGVSYKPENLKTAIDDNSVVLLRSNNIRSGTLNFENVQIVPDSLVSDSQILKKGDIAVCMSNGSRQLVGKSGMLQHEIEYPLTIGAFCSVFRCQNEDDSEYVRYLFQSQAYQHGIDVALAGSAINNLKNSDIEAIEVPTAPKELRKKIAEILSTIDNQIDATQAFIDKYTAIKQGMMADLFSRGIDPETKALRPTFEEAPELYHKTPLGMLPKGWLSLSLADVAAQEKGSTVIGPFGSDLVAADYTTEGVPIVFVRDVKVDRFHWKSNTYVSHAKARALKAHSAQTGDVIVTKMGLPPCIAAVYPDSMPNGIITADIIRLRPNDALAFSDWVAIAINSNEMRKQVEAITAGVTRPKVTLKDFRQLTGRFPPKKEQKLILDRLEPIKSLIESEEAAIAKLKLQKQGLMQDLLTGKVPVAA